MLVIQKAQQSEKEILRLLVSALKRSTCRLYITFRQVVLLVRYKRPWRIIQLSSYTNEHLIASFHRRRRRDNSLQKLISPASFHFNFFLPPCASLKFPPISDEPIGLRSLLRENSRSKANIIFCEK